METNKRRSWILILLLILVSLYYFLAVKHTVKLFDEQEVFTERQTGGIFWVVITDEGYRISFGKKYKVELPANDFNRFYLLVADGRRVVSLRYSLMSRFQWQYRFFKGEEVFEERHYPHSMFVYRMKKIYLHRAVD